jgi:hypothetical protein
MTQIDSRHEDMRVVFEAEMVERIRVNVMPSDVHCNESGFQRDTPRSPTEERVPRE